MQEPFAAIGSHLQQKTRYPMLCPSLDLTTVASNKVPSRSLHTTTELRKATCWWTRMTKWHLLVRRKKWSKPRFDYIHTWPLPPRPTHPFHFIHLHSAWFLLLSASFTKRRHHFTRIVCRQPFVHIVNLDNLCPQRPPYSKAIKKRILDRKSPLLGTWIRTESRLSSFVINSITQSRLFTIFEILSQYLSQPKPFSFFNNLAWLFLEPFTICKSTTPLHHHSIRPWQCKEKTFTSTLSSQALLPRHNHKHNISQLQPPQCALDLHPPPPTPPPLNKPKAQSPSSSSS